MLTGLPPRAIWRKGVGRTFQIAQTFARSAWWKTCRWLLSADQRIFTGGRRRRHRQADALALLEQVGMPPRPIAPAAPWPMAMKRVELAMALAHSPRCC
jgi:branched-chain amino acid transport system ATP-binding protein